MINKVFEKDYIFKKKSKFPNGIPECNAIFFNNFNKSRYALVLHYTLSCVVIFPCAIRNQV